MKGKKVLTTDEHRFTQMEKDEKKLPEGWEWKKLGEVCEYDKNQNYHNAPYVGLEDIEANSGRFIGDNNARKVKSKTFSFNRSHVLYGRLRPYLNKVFVPDFRGHCSTEIFPIKVSNNVDRKFFANWLMMEKIVSRINETSTGARMPRANMKVVLDLSIPLPPLSEQKHIVAILDEAFAAIDKAKANAEKNLANAKELFASYLNGIFANPGEDWEEKKLCEICIIKHGFAFEGKFFFNKGNYVLLTPGNFYEEGGYRYRGEKQKYYTGEIPQDFILDKGDLLIAMTEQAHGLLGSSMIVPEHNKFLHNQRLGLVKPAEGAVWNTEFIAHLFNSVDIRNKIEASASGVKVRHTSPKKIGDINVWIPMSLSVQQNIAHKINVLIKEAKQLESIYQQKIAALDELKKSILKKAFEGEL